jgi:hypothetical protein
MEEKEPTFIEVVPTENELKATAIILNSRNFIDFDYLTYKRIYKIEEVSTLMDLMNFDDEYLFHRLLLKCAHVYLFDGMNAKLRQIIESNLTYTLGDKIPTYKKSDR